MHFISGQFPKRVYFCMNFLNEKEVKTFIETPLDWRSSVTKSNLCARLRDSIKSISEDKRKKFCQLKQEEIKNIFIEYVSQIEGMSDRKYNNIINMFNFQFNSFFVFRSKNSDKMCVFLFNRREPEGN